MGDRGSGSVGRIFWRRTMKNALFALAGYV